MEKGKLLTELQSIQAWAYENNIYYFAITTNVYPFDDGEPRYIVVTIFRTGDDSEDDHYREVINESANDAVIQRAVNRIKLAVGYV